MMRASHKAGQRYKYVINAVPYRDDSGGAIVLHKLCHLINALGYDAYLLPITQEKFSFVRRFSHGVTARFPALAKVTGRRFVTNPSFNTPLLTFGVDLNPKNTIQVYPDVVYGNPFSAQRVVRWFLHKPGFHTGRTEFGRNEFHIDFNQFLLEHTSDENHISPSKLHVVHYAFDLYNQDDALPAPAREGAAYCVRKGKIDPAIDLSDAVCIDGKSHAEIAELFKRVKYFYAFDPYTAYSQFAALCGALSFVIAPDLKRENWYQNDEDRYGIGFGLEDEEWARSTQNLVAPLLKNREEMAKNSVLNFVEETHAFFG